MATLIRIAVCLSKTSLSEYDEVTSVTVDGMGAIIGNYTARARDEVLRDAYRIALLKAYICGTEIRR